MALQEADAVLQAARDEGFASGRAEARASVADGRSPALATWRAASTDQRAALEESAVREATSLAVEIAARLVRAEVSVRPERVADVLRGAIRRAADRSRLVARVSPADLAACRAAAPAILQGSAASRASRSSTTRASGPARACSRRAPATSTRPSRASSAASSRPSRRRRTSLVPARP